MGRIDARIRWALAAVFLTLAAVFHDLIVASAAALLLSLLCAGTALTRNCPVYAMLHLTTAVDPSHNQQP